ncbi:MAG: IPTL-CTERM sorting domain-containing protein [Thermoanaerobaculia bacterium]|nr:IPTL-CTERM sorting domain-containing protein [Thermoanaerobaculia bacterium]
MKRLAPCLLLLAVPVEAANFTVTNTFDSGAGSLRQAVIDANGAPAPPHRIEFAIPGTGPHVITLGPTQLPTLTVDVEVDGYSQPGATPNTSAVGFNADLRIILDGSGAAPNGFQTSTPQAIFRGLRIRNFQATGLFLTGGGAVTGCHIEDNNFGVALSLFGGTVGGPTFAERNLVSGNRSVGLSIESVGLTTVVGNFVGTDASGLAADGNGVGAQVINGAVTLLDNFISGNQFAGVFLITRDDFHLRVLHGNWIGLGGDRGTPVPNLQTGIRVDGTGGVRIGGPGLGEGNQIAYNGGDGILVVNGFRGELSTATIEANRIHDNGGLGIDLGDDGVTANDSGDADTGPNGLTNFPLLTSAQRIPGGLRLSGTLAAQPATTYRLFFYDSDNCDATGNGEGQRSLWSLDVTTDAAGAANFSTDAFGADGAIITATAAHPTAGTSEFSPCVPVVAGNLNVLEVPTLSPFAIVALGLLLAMAGGWVLRRRETV